MAITRSRSKTLITLIGFAVITVTLSACSQGNKQKRDAQLSYNCKNKVWYDVPDLQFKGYPLTTKPVVIIKRNGEILENKLRLKEISKSDTLNFQLVAVNTDTVAINKSDTIVISLANKEYAIYGFKSNAYYGDHDILDCDEQYQLNGKLFRIKELNWIFYSKN